MNFDGIKLIEIDSLGISQIYLSSKKIASVTEWFDASNTADIHPLPVHDFGNNKYTLTDGHTRAYVAYKCGVSSLPVFYDNDDIITNPIGKEMYMMDIEWAKRFELLSIARLENRILNEADYQKLWIERCDRCYNLITKTSIGERAQFQQLSPDFFLYGASEDISVLFFENKYGELFLYEDNVLLPENRLS